MEKVGFVGLGIMGNPMAKNLIKNGVDLYVNDLNESAISELVSLGATAASKQEIGSVCDVIFTILPNGEIVEATLLDLFNEANKNVIICDMSSITPIQAKHHYELCLNYNWRYVDAPVSGGEVGAIEGKLAFMVGGEELVFNKLNKYFEILGNSAILVGDIGSGSVTKLANQIIVNNNIAVMSEALVFAKKAGTDPEKVYEAIKNGLAGSAVLDAKAPIIINRDFKPGGKISINHKDVKNIVDTAHQIDVPVPYSAQLFEIMQVLKINGKSNEDHGAIVKYFEMLAKTVVEPNGN